EFMVMSRAKPANGHAIIRRNCFASRPLAREIDGFGNCHLYLWQNPGFLLRTIYGWNFYYCAKHPACKSYRTMTKYDFEKPLTELEDRIRELEGQESPDQAELEQLREE